MLFRTIIILISFNFVLFMGQAVARPVLAGDGMARLDRYDVLSFTDPIPDGLKKGKAIGVFDATPEEIFRVITEYEHYNSFIPRVVSSQVIDRHGDTSAFVFLLTDLPWPVRDAWVLAQFEHEQLGANTYRIRFWQIRGSLRRYAGSALIEPWAGNKSAVTYELIIEPDMRASHHFINGRIEQVTALYLHSLRQHINNLHHAGMLHPLVSPDPALVSPLAGARQPVPVDQSENVAHAK